MTFEQSEKIRKQIAAQHQLSSAFMQSGTQQAAITYQAQLDAITAGMQAHVSAMQAGFQVPSAWNSIMQTQNQYYHLATTLNHSMTEMARGAAEMTNLILNQASVMADMTQSVTANMAVMMERIQSAACIDWRGIGNVTTSVHEIVENLPLEEMDGGDVLSAEEEEALFETIAEIKDEPRGWQVTLFQAVCKWKDKNPVVAFILAAALTHLIGCAMSGVYGTVKRAVMRDKPCSTAVSVIKIESQQPIRVVDQVPYYYKVQYYDEETGEMCEGWIYKGAAKPQGECLAQGERD